MFILGPNDSPVHNSTSDMTDARFGGARAITDGIQKAEDYTKRTTDARDIVENPEATKDVDDLNDPQARKHDTKYQDDLVNAGTPGDNNFIISDLEKKPLDEGREDSAFQKPDPDRMHSTLHPFNPDFWDVTGVTDEDN